MVPPLRIIAGVVSVLAITGCWNSRPRERTADAEAGARCARGQQVPVARVEVTTAADLVARYDGELPPALRHPVSDLSRWDPYVVCVHRDGRVRLLDAIGEADLPNPPPPAR